MDSSAHRISNLVNTDTSQGNAVDGDEDFEESVHWIEDRIGRRLQARFAKLESSWRFRVYDGEAWVADAKCGVRDGELTLGDLQVFNAAPVPLRGLIGRIRAVLGRPKAFANYRRQGVGSALLSLIVRMASKQGLREITGSLSPRDLESNPGLPDWYRHRGFTVRPGGAFGEGSIHMKLPATS